ncbi:MAG: hypothetical protein ACYDCQ_16500 [Dehalococcoidia bacterium]
MIEKEMIRGPAEIPPFASEDEEVEFWETHDFGEEFLSQLQPPTGNVAELLRRFRAKGTEVPPGPRP